MAKKVVLSGYFGFKNFGDEVILSLLVSKLRETETDITVITSNPDYTKFVNGDVECIKTFDLPLIIKKIKTSDVLISGGGSLLQDVTSLKSLIYYLLIIIIAQILRKKVIIFAQGIGPVNNIFGRFLTKFALKRCNYISVRDEGSLKLLESWKIPSDLVCDPVFSIPFNTVEKNKTVGVQLRQFKGINKEFLNNLANHIISEFEGYDIELFSLQNSIDSEICIEFRQILHDKNKNISVSVNTDMTATETINKISHCEYLISMRFHPVIIALLAGVKVLPINYDIKVEKLAKEFNLPIINLDKPFENEFRLLKSQDLAPIRAILNNKKFDWKRIISEINS